MLNITLLGTGGGMPMPDRFLSSMIINYQSRKILIDCGEGTQVSMRKNKSGFKSLDIICLTHVHGDHIFGLPGLLSTIGNSHRADPITIIGPIGIRKIIEGMTAAIPYLPFEIDILELQKITLYLDISPHGLVISQNTDRSPDNSGLILSTLELDHSAPCLGYSFYVPRKPKFYPEKAIYMNIPKKYWNRLQNGETVTDGNRTFVPSMILGEERKGIKLTYITDTRPTNLIPEFIYESDVFVCEGTYGDDRDLEKAIKNKHMTFAEAAQLASIGGVKELWLTHFSPAMDKPELYINNAKNTFLKTILGYDGISRSIKFPTPEM